MQDWIKMRTDLYRDPKVCLMADHLLNLEHDLARYVNQNMQRNMAVTRNVMRCATVGATLAVWGVMRHRGKRNGDDLTCSGVTVQVLDDIADLPGFGEAMQSCGWVAETDEGIVFPRFFAEYNVEIDDKGKSSAAERQARYRQSQKAKRDGERDATRDVTSDGREEKRREEKSTVVIPQSARPPQATPEAQQPEQPQPPETLPATIQRSSFRKPTVQDVAEYATSACLDMDPQAFFDYYVANGWRVGRNAMKDWKAAARNWAKRDEEYRSNHAGQSSRAPANTFQRETPFERNQRNEQQQLQLLADMCAIAEEQNARHAAEQQARNASGGLLGHADSGADHR
jgi:hypothetical protein